MENILVEIRRGEEGVPVDVGVETAPQKEYMHPHHEARVDGEASWQHAALSHSRPWAREAVGGVLEGVVDLTQETSAALGGGAPEGEEAGAGEAKRGADLVDRRQVDV